MIWAQLRADADRGRAVREAEQTAKVREDACPARMAAARLKHWEETNGRPYGTGRSGQDQ